MLDAGHIQMNGFPPVTVTCRPAHMFLAPVHADSVTGAVIIGADVPAQSGALASLIEDED
jgi:hypothetical protein